MARDAIRRPAIEVATLTAVIAVASATVGCRSCAEERGASSDAGVSGPTMPTGMLVPPGAGGEGGVGAAVAEPGASAAVMKITRGVKGGSWTELQVARPGDTAARTHFQHWRDDSVFLSLEAMTALHACFARALPGFDLFLPRLFTPEALVALGNELDAFTQRSSGDIATTARELSILAKDTAKKGQSLWVLGP